MKKTKKENLPFHVAVIPDGNRRWAKRRDLDPWKGHEEGAKTVLLAAKAIDPDRANGSGRERCAIRNAPSFTLSSPVRPAKEPTASVPVPSFSIEADPSSVPITAS